MFARHPRSGSVSDQEANSGWDLRMQIHGMTDLAYCWLGVTAGTRAKGQGFAACVEKVPQDSRLHWKPEVAQNV